MTPNRLGLLAVTLCLAISGCTSVVSASREAPIDDDRGTRTIGSKIDDSLIETKVGVNVDKADPGSGQEIAHRCDQLQRCRFAGRANTSRRLESQGRTGCRRRATREDRAQRAASHGAFRVSWLARTTPG